MDRDAFEKLQALAAAAAPPVEPQPQGMQFGFDVVEVQRVGLQPGDVLMVTVKNDDLSQDSVDGLRKQLQVVFPSNKVFVFAMGTSDEVQLSIVSQAVGESCGPVGYCNDCNCGKKEAAEMSNEDFLKTLENQDEHMKNLAKQAGDET